ncbi:hypothetical protein FOZ63_004258, partial [Perkinsus olseni]
QLPTPEEIGPSRSSTTSAAQAASNAEDDLTTHHKRAIGSTELRERISLRLKTQAEVSGASGKKAKSKGKVVRRVAQKCAADRKDKPKPSVKRQKELRQKKRQERDDGVSSSWEALQSTNPLDDVSLHLKERLAVYVPLTQFYGYWGWQSREVVEDFAADLFDLKPSSVHRWCHDFETAHYLEEDRRGKHSEVRSPLFDAEYQGFRERFRHYVKANSIGKDGSPNLTADALPEWVNSDMELGEGDKVLGAFGEEYTLCRWAREGRCRHDIVVADRQRLYKELEE